MHLFSLERVGTSLFKLTEVGIERVDKMEFVLLLAGLCILAVFSCFDGFFLPFLLLSVEANRPRSMFLAALSLCKLWV